MTSGESLSPVLFMFSTVTEEAEPNAPNDNEGKLPRLSVQSRRLFYYSENGGANGAAEIRNVSM